MIRNVCYWSKSVIFRSIDCYIDCNYSYVQYKNSSWISESGWIWTFSGIFSGRSVSTSWMIWISSTSSWGPSEDSVQVGPTGSSWNLKLNHLPIWKYSLYPKDIVNNKFSLKGHIIWPISYGPYGMWNSVYYFLPII